MAIKILLILSMILQLLAAITAIRLTRVTKYNFSWILFTIALTTMTIMRLGEYSFIVRGSYIDIPDELFVWLGIGTSLCFAIGVLYVNKIFQYITRSNSIKVLTEKRILSAILRTEEKERLRFSKDLHDGLGPLLSSSKMSMSALQKDQLSTYNLEIIDSTIHVLDEAIRSLKDISNNLSPHTLTDFGLAKATNNFINKTLKGVQNIEIKLTTNLKDERFNTDIEVILYRVICELINNSLKHSKGSIIEVSIQYDGSQITLNYSDNGIGFNPEAVMDIGMGLSNITSRIRSLKGKCVMKSTEGEGAKTFITIDIYNNGSREKL